MLEATTPRPGSHICPPAGQTWENRGLASACTSFLCLKLARLPPGLQVVAEPPAPQTPVVGSPSLHPRKTWQLWLLLVLSTRGQHRTRRQEGPTTPARPHPGPAACSPEGNEEKASTWSCLHSPRTGSLLISLKSHKGPRGSMQLSLLTMKPRSREVKGPARGHTARK